MHSVEVMLEAPAAAPTGARAPSGEAIRFLATDGANVLFKDVPIGRISRSASADLLAARRAYKAQLFDQATQALARDPALADVPKCASAEESLSGRCAIGDLAVMRAASSAPADLFNGHIPRIRGKRALVIGLDRYDDARIPQLVSAVADARAVGASLADKLGYAVTRLDNPSKAELVRAFNQLGSEMRDADSLIVYFAGHGTMVDATRLGYWLPRDASASDPSGWISNADVSRWLAAIRSRQVAVVSDSCYSGTFASDDLDPQQVDAQRVESVLDRRSVTVLTSGSDEPVADTGKNGHSVFAWRLLQELDALRTWSAGSSLFAAIRTEVESELPQTPRYGAARDAGHEQGGEFLFERRARLR